MYISCCGVSGSRWNTESTGSCSGGQQSASEDGNDIIWRATATRFCHQWHRELWLCSVNVQVKPQWGRLAALALFRLTVAPCGAGAPLFSPLSIYFLIFPLFTFLFLSLALLILFFCPSLPLIIRQIIRRRNVHKVTTKAPFYQNSPTPFPGRRS